MSTAETTMTPDKEAAREAARALGSIRTAKKAASSRANGFKPGHTFGKGRTLAPLSEIECAVKVGKTPGPCSGGDSLEGHHWSCPRGQAILRRQKQGRDPQTGEKLEKS